MVLMIGCRILEQFTDRWAHAFSMSILTALDFAGGMDTNVHEEVLTKVV